MATRTISTKLAIDGEGEYRAALSRVNTELKTLQSSLKLTESQFQTNANSMEALKAKGDALTGLYEAQKTKVDTLRAALENAKSAHDNFAQKSEELKAKIQANNEALEKLRATTGDTTAEEQKLLKENEALNAELAKNEQYAAAAEKGVNSWQTQLNKAQIDLNNLDAELKQNDALLDEAKSSSDGCAHSIDEFGNKVKESSEATEKQNEALEAMAAALAAAGIVAGLEKIKDALKACVEASMEFEAGMSAVGAIANASTEEMDLLSEKAKELGASTMFTAGQSAEAMQYMALAGWSAEEMLKGVDGVIKLAAASGENLASVSDIVTDALTAFGLKAEDSGHFVDVLAKTASSSNTTVSMLGEAFKYAAPLAGALGYSVEDVAVAMGLMANQGIKGSQAGTAMRTMFTKLAGDITLTADAFGEVTLSAANSDGTIKPLSQSLDELRYYFGQMTEAEKLANAEAVAGKYAMSGLTAIMNTTQEDFDSLTRSIGDCAGAADTMAKTRMDNLQGQVTLLSSAFDALKISVGDDLNPALRGLAETGTDIVTWAGDFVEEHENIVPIITAVATGMTALTGAVTAYAAAKKIVIPLITAFNGALMASPVGLAATAFATLTAALVTLAATMPDTASEYEKLSASSKLQYDELERLNGEYQKACELYGENSEVAQRLASQLEAESALFEKNKTTANQFVNELDDLISKNERLGQTGQEARDAIEAQRESSEYLVEKLQSLQEEENKSIGVKQQIIEVVQELNQEIPDLGLAYDDYSGKLNMTAESIKKVIEKELERRELEANIDDLLDRERIQRENAEAMAALLEEQAAAKERLAKATEDMNAALADDDGDDSRAALTRMTEYISAVNEAQSYVDELAEKEQTLTEKMAANGAEIERLNGLITGYQEETSAAYSAEEQAVKQVSDSLAALAKAYRDAYDAAHDSLDSQIGLWTKMDNEASTSVGNLQEAVNSQVTYLERYSDNLSSLLGRNIEGIERFAQNFTDGSAESAAALAGLSTASDEEIRKLMDSMSQVDGYKDSLSSLFAALETNLTGSLASIKDQYASAIAEISKKGGDVDFSPFVTAVQEQFSAVGAQITQKAEDTGKNIDLGLQNGLALGRGEVYLAANAMGQGVVDSLITVFDSHSPSRVTEKIGKDVDDGLAQGISGQAEPVMSAANSLGEELTEQMRTAGHESVEGFNEEFRAITDHVQEMLEETKSIISGFSWPIAGEAQSLGIQMVDGMISGIYGNSGSLYSAMAEVTREAIEAARQAADTHSPSKKTAKIFEDVGEGMVVGIEAKKQKVRAATANVVNNALWISPDSIRELSRSINASIPDFGSLLGSRNERNGEVASGGSAKVGKSNNYHIEMNITTQPGQNNKEIAEYVMDRMQQELERKGGAF